MNDAHAELELHLGQGTEDVVLTPTATAGGYSATASPSLTIDVNPLADGAQVLFDRKLKGGGLAVIGNSNVTCDEESVPDCVTGRDSLTGRAVNRQQNQLIAVTQLAVGETNSSSATLTIPENATIEQAFLVWGGLKAQGTPAAPKLLSPGDDYSSGTVVAALPGSPHTNSTDRGIYEGFADVTAQVLKAGAGVYTVADIDTTYTPVGGLGLGGWSLFVVYADTTAATSSTVAVIDRYSTLGADPSSLSLPGFTAGQSHALSMAYFATEGDFGNIDHRAVPPDPNGTASVTLAGTLVGGGTDTENPQPNNVFNSSIVGMDARAPGFRNNFGIDVDRFELPQVTIGADGLVSATFSSDTATDTVNLGAVGFVIS